MQNIQRQIDKELGGLEFGMAMVQSPDTRVGGASPMLIRRSDAASRERVVAKVNEGYLLLSISCFFFDKIEEDILVSLLQLFEDPANVEAAGKLQNEMKKLRAQNPDGARSIRNILQHLFARGYSQGKCF